MVAKGCSERLRLCRAKRRARQWEHHLLLGFRIAVQKYELPAAGTWFILSGSICTEVSGTGNLRMGVSNTLAITEVSGISSFQRLWNTQRDFMILR